MSNDRAEELVLAGSAPGRGMAVDPITHVHRGTSFIVLVDGAIVLYLMATALAALGVLSTGGGQAFMAGMVFMVLSTYMGYRQRRPWAYWPAVSLLSIAGLMFGFLALLNLMQGLVGGYLVGLLFAFLMGWAAFGSFRRAVFHWHPVYRSGYRNGLPQTNFDLAEGEMYAACPSCLAVLAVRPALLGPSDRCPHCQTPLVSEALYAKYRTEEE